MQGSEFLPLLYYIGFFRTGLAPVDLAGGKQATRGDKKLTVVYYMDYSPLSNIRQLNEMGVANSLLGM